jgi:hypothetical protein
MINTPTLSAKTGQLQPSVGHSTDFDIQGRALSFS